MRNKLIATYWLALLRYPDHLQQKCTCKRSANRLRISDELYKQLEFLAAEILAALILKIDCTIYLHQISGVK